MRSYPVLVVADPKPAELAEDSWGGSALMHAGQAEAIHLVGRRLFGGLVVVVDGTGPLRRSRELIEAYLRQQPMGHVAVLSGTPCATMSTLFSYLPARVDIFFAPWDLDAVRTFLKLESMPAESHV